MIPFLDHWVGPKYSGPVVLAAVLIVGGGLSGFFAWLDQRYRP